jgi:uncharacterized protein YcfJ
MNILLPLVLALAGSAIAGQAAAQVTFYERNDYQGRSFTTDDTVENFERHGFNGRASSATVQGGRTERWEVCEERRFGGRCVVLRPGQYGSLQAMGLQGRVASVRAVERVGRGDDRRDDRRDDRPQPAVASQIDFYENEGFKGRSFTTALPLADFRASGFNDRASSAVVTGSGWEVCQNTGYSGPCVVLKPGQYPSLAAIGINNRISSARAAAAPTPPPMAMASRIALYENDGFQGRSMMADGAVEDFRSSGFNDRASSAVVSGGRFEVCNDARYGGNCVVLRPGQYPSLGAMGLNDRISSVRPVGRDVRVEDRRFAPLPVVAQDYGRRNGERLYEATITSVRAVVDNAGQRCWVEPQQAVQERSGANVPGALLGAVIGGILGHQVGGGTGRDVATGIGVVAGAAIGSNVGRGEDSQQVVQTQGVQRCSGNAGPARPTYWDVTYSFRNQEYRVQMNREPGRTITVNEQGEPRA